MFIVVGAHGHVGSEVMKVLASQGRPVTAVTHRAEHAKHWQAAGARVALADVTSPSSLRAAFKMGRRAFILNPPASVDSDTDQVERHSVACILEALQDSGLEKVVAQSTGGARAGDRLGDLNVLWELEQGLTRQPIPAAINRAGFYMSNWDAQLDHVRHTGELVSLFPADLHLPMAAPRDLGRMAAERLLSSIEDTAIRYVEGPARYCANDVARAFAQALGRDVRVVVKPRAQWEESYRQQGFSRAAAQSYARMTAVAMDELDLPDDSLRGQVTLEAYIAELAERGGVERMSED